LFVFATRYLFYAPGYPMQQDYILQANEQYLKPVERSNRSLRGI